MAAGITVSIDDGEIEKIISRLTAGVTLASVETAEIIDAELTLGKRLAEKNIETFVYALPEGKYKRTFKLAHAVRTGTIAKAGTVKAGQVYITRQPFKRSYYPVYVEYGFEAGAPYTGRYYWAATVAELKAGVHIPVAAAARRVANKMVK